MRMFSLTVTTILLLSHAAFADCTSAADPAQKNIFLAALTEPNWCWPAVDGGVGNIVYMIESRTNGGDWVAEGERDLPEWTASGSIGETIEMRFYACDVIQCTDYSPVSQRVLIYPNFDTNGDGMIDAVDYAAVRLTLDGIRFTAFRAVFNSPIVEKVYLQ